MANDIVAPKNMLPRCDAPLATSNWGDSDCNRTKFYTSRYLQINPNHAIYKIQNTVFHKIAQTPKQNDATTEIHNNN